MCITSKATPSQLRADKRAAALSLDTWVKSHPRLQAVPLAQGEASVTLLLLWEADHRQLYPCGKVDLCFRLNSFTKRLVDTVAANSELSAWTQRKKSRSVLSPGLRQANYTRLAVRINPEAGQPFLGTWNVYLASVQRQQQGPLHRRDSSSSGSSRNGQSLRQHLHKSGNYLSPPPPSRSKQAERPQATKTASSAGTTALSDGLLIFLQSGSRPSQSRVLPPPPRARLAPAEPGVPEHTP